MVDLSKLPLVSLINPHPMLGCLYCVRGLWRQATCQYPTSKYCMTAEVVSKNWSELPRHIC